MNNSRKPSDIIEDFLNLFSQSHTEVASAQTLIEAENSRTLIQTHTLEDCTDDQIYEFAKQWRDDLKKRRIECDRKALYDNIHRFGISEQNKSTLKRLKTLLSEQKKTEDYLAIPYNEREFKGN